jgi:hypothetical protein
MLLNIFQDSQDEQDWGREQLSRQKIEPEGLALYSRTAFKKSSNEILLSKRGFLEAVLRIQSPLRGFSAPSLIDRPFYPASPIYPDILLFFRKSFKINLHQIVHQIFITYG